MVVTCYSLIVMQAHKYQREMSRIAHGGPNKTGDMATIINHVGSVRKTQRSLRLHNKLIRVSACYLISGISLFLNSKSRMLERGSCSTVEQMELVCSYIKDYMRKNYRIINYI